MSSGQSSLIPPPVSAYVNAGTGWAPAEAAGTAGTEINFTPPPAGLYLLDPGTNQWAPCTSLGGGGGAPSGPAGGDLTGTYPNPQVAGSSVATTFHAPITSSFTPTLGQSALVIADHPASGGTGTTTLPLIFVNDPNATAQSSTWSTAGTIFGMNYAATIGNVLDFQRNGISLFSMTAGGQVTFTSMLSTAAHFNTGVTIPSIKMSNIGVFGFTPTGTVTANPDVAIGRFGVGIIQIGMAPQTTAGTNSNGSLMCQHLLGGGAAAPTVAAGSGAGTGATAALQAGSTDTSGYLNLTTGSAGEAGSSPIATITFNAAYPAAPKVILTPANAAAAALTGAVQVFADVAQVTAGAFVIEAGATALAVSTAYVWAYQVIG